MVGQSSPCELGYTSRSPNSAASTVGPADRGTQVHGQDARATHKLTVDRPLQPDPEIAELARGGAHGLVDVLDVAAHRRPNRGQEPV